MAWLPINKLPTQFLKADNTLASDYWLKFYDANTANEVSMATDATGVAKLVQCQLSTSGYPLATAGNDATVFIPHMEVNYRVILYATEEDATNNLDSNAVWNIASTEIGAVITGDAADITLRDTTIQTQDDFDRSILFTDGDGFTAGAGPHVFTVTSDYTPTDSDFRAYKRDASGIMSIITTLSETATQFTYNETLASTDTIFVGDDTNRVLAVNANSTDTTRSYFSYTVSPSVNYASLTGYRFSIAAQATGASSILFNNNGLKIYVADENTNTIYEYDLSTAYDITTAAYNSNNFSITSQTTIAPSMKFNNNGTKIFVLGTSVYEYDLSTAYDITSASFSTSFSISEDASPEGLAFNNDGSVMYVTGGVSTNIYEYDLSTGFDVSTAVYNAVNISLVIAGDIVISSDGKKLFLSAGATDVYEYIFETAYDLSTLDNSDQTFDASKSIRSIALGRDGLMFIGVTVIEDYIEEGLIGLVVPDLGN